MRTLRLFPIALGFLTCSAAAGQPGKHQDIALIVHRANPLDGLSMSELKQILRADRIRWADGKRIVLVTREASLPEQAAMLARIYGMTPAEFKRYFIQAAFTGKTQTLPKVLDTAADAKAFVAANPGAIAYIRASELDGSVKSLRLDGRAPGEAGYKLHLGP